MRKSVTTSSATETENLGKLLGQRLRGGEVVELVSDLGGGKTTFTRGLVAGLKATDSVASPTFTISREYTSGRLRVHHFDFYRLPEAGIIADELAEIIGDAGAVVVVEWANVVESVLPNKRITISFTTTGEETRTIHIDVPNSLQYAVEDIT